MRPKQSVLGYRALNSNTRSKEVREKGAIPMGRGGKAYFTLGWNEAECHPAHYSPKEWDWKLPRHTPGVPSPDPNCHCGIYGFHGRRRRDSGLPVIIESVFFAYLVLGSGRIVYGTENQWRAQYVKPVAVAVADHVFDGGRAKLVPPGEVEKYRALWQKTSEFYDIPIIPYRNIDVVKELYDVDWELPKGAA